MGMGGPPLKSMAVSSFLLWAPAAQSQWGRLGNDANTLQNHLMQEQGGRDT